MAQIEYPLQDVTVPATAENAPGTVRSSVGAQAASPKEPWDGDQAFKDLVRQKGFACPGSPVGDYAFTAWLYDFYRSASGGTAPVAAPIIESLDPASGVAAADVTVAIAGSGFDAGATVDVGGTTLTPQAGATASSLSVIIPGTALPLAGSVLVAVKNGDAQWSNQLSFEVT